MVNGMPIAGTVRIVRIVRIARGFTLIELIVVMAIIALLVSIAAPRYFTHIDRSKEAVLRQDLQVFREAIDKYYGDKGQYPSSLEDLVSSRYIRNLPVDPITEKSDSWVVVPPPDREAKGDVYDVKSGAPGQSKDGTEYSTW
jgi:general secretion pathway protein G